MTIFDQKKLEIELKLSVNNLMEWNADSESKADSELSGGSQHNAIERDETPQYILYNPYSTYSVPGSPHLSVLVTDNEENTKCALLDSNHDLVSNIIEISNTLPAK